jgi:hypothetical protein
LTVFFFAFVIFTLPSFDTAEAAEVTDFDDT